MKQFVFFLLSIFISVTLKAQSTPTGTFFDGSWYGELNITSDPESGYICAAKIYITIDHQEVAIRQSLRGNCYYDSYVLFETDGETLYQFGSPVGTINEQKIQFSNVYEHVNGDFYSAEFNLLNEQQIKMSDSTEYSTGLVSTTEGFLYKDGEN